MWMYNLPIETSIKQQLEEETQDYPFLIRDGGCIVVADLRRPQGRNYKLNGQNRQRGQQATIPTVAFLAI